MRFWEELGEKLGGAARAGLALGAVLILAGTAALGVWLLRTDYQPLFTDLTPQDTAAMTAELDREKIPYVLGDQGSGGASILVDRSEVYKTRIKLMGKDIPMHGTVGFELFNNNDFGMTEFAQKVNYQRALQGELTRTILSLSEIRDARVLLALPEQGLFKQATSKPKASVTVTLKEGRKLAPAQVAGIQRLVAASVAGIQGQDVTLVDQSGVALSRPGEADDEGGAGTSAWRLDLKKDTEAYLAKKALQVLDRALGPGQALASVDVTLNMDRVQTHTEEVLGAPAGKDETSATGIMVRERETIRETEPPLGAQASSEARPAAPGGSNQHETEYAVGKRVEQVISQPGSIEGLQVAVVVNQPLAPNQAEQLRSIVAASIGLDAERGDRVVVQSMTGLVAPAQQPVAPAPPARPGEEAVRPGALAQREAGVRAPALFPKTWVPGLAALGLVLALLGLRAVFRRSRLPVPAEAGLTEAERLAALNQVQVWLQGFHPQPAGGAGSGKLPVPLLSGPKGGGAG